MLPELRIGFYVELKDADGLLELVGLHQLVAQSVQFVFVEVVSGGRGRL